MEALTFREATAADLSRLVEMLADDPLGAVRERFEDPLPGAYRDAFDAIDADPANELVVAERGGVVVGFLQLTVIPNLTYVGRSRVLIEGVRVEADNRGRGVGRALVEWAVSRARDHRCHMVQLTTDKTRASALHFYEELGFRATHEGMKLHL
jgi:GNAT superfamily N-acetyltransferase